MNVLRVTLFGEVRVSRGANPVPLDVTHSTQALLAYLLLSPHRPQSRDVLADVFWSDRTQERARNCLNTALWRLRRSLEPDGVSDDGTYLLTTLAGDVSFNWQSEYWLDVSIFEANVHQALAQSIEIMTTDEAQRLEETLQLYTGELLEGFYDDWVIRERERLRQLYLNGLHHLMRFYHHQGEFDQALACGLKILDLDPLREEIHRAVMRIYLDRGERVLAVRQYETCRALLADELGIQPMAETQALYARIAADTDAAVPLTPGNIFDSQRALRQLHATLRNLEKIQDQLKQAIQFVEQLTVSRDSERRP
jgi:DNA-binding SARP family transcriptional activator